MNKHGKEKSTKPMKGAAMYFMTFLKCLKWIIIAVGVVAVIMKAVAEWRCSKGRKADKTEQEPMPVREKNAQNAEVDQKRMMQLQAEANRLDSAMQLLVTSSTGMLACRKIVREDQSQSRTMQFRNSFKIKQKQLKELYSQYEALKKENPDLYPLENDALYHELMNEQL